LDNKEKWIYNNIKNIVENYTRYEFAFSFYNRNKEYIDINDLGGIRINNIDRNINTIEEILMLYIYSEVMLSRQNIKRFYLEMINNYINVNPYVIYSFKGNHEEALSCVANRSNDCDQSKTILEEYALIIEQKNKSEFEINDNVIIKPDTILNELLKSVVEDDVEREISNYVDPFDEMTENDFEDFLQENIQNTDIGVISELIETKTKEDFFNILSNKKKQRIKLDTTDISLPPEEKSFKQIYLDSSINFPKPRSYEPQITKLESEGKQKKTIRSPKISFFNTLQNLQFTFIIVSH